MSITKTFYFIDDLSKSNLMPRYAIGPKLTNLPELQSKIETKEKKPDFGKKNSLTGF
jgi:hypothetical protein